MAWENLRDELADLFGELSAAEQSDLDTWTEEFRAREAERWREWWVELQLCPARLKAHYAQRKTREAGGRYVEKRRESQRDRYADNPEHFRAKARAAYRLRKQDPAWLEARRAAHREAERTRLASLKADPAKHKAFLAERRAKRKALAEARRAVGRAA
jgi:hypothetical protein